MLCNNLFWGLLVLYVRISIFLIYYSSTCFIICFLSLQNFCIHLNITSTKFCIEQIVLLFTLFLFCGRYRISFVRLCNLHVVFLNSIELGFFSGRFRWPCGLRRKSSVVQLQEFRVRFCTFITLYRVYTKEWCGFKSE